MASQLYICSLLRHFEGVSTDGHTPQSFYVPENGITTWIEQTGNTSLKEDAWCVPDICQSPTGIWQGLDRRGQEKTLVYAGIPTGAFASEYDIVVGEDFTIPSNKVFLVFLSSDFGVAKFRFEDPDPSNPSYPINFKNRFTSQLWP